MRNEHIMTGFVQVEADRVGAAAIVKRYRDGIPTKRWGSVRTSIARAANESTDNPVLRLRSWIRRGRRIGIPRQRAELIVADLMAVIEEEYPSRSLSFAAAAIDETIAQSAEDLAEIRALTAPASDTLSAYASAARECAAALITAAAAAEAEAGRTQRGAA